MHRSSFRFWLIAGLLLLAITAGAAGVDDSLNQTLGRAIKFGGSGNSSYLKTMLLLTMVSLIPILLVAATSYTRILIVLSSVRLGLGMPETPSNPVLITLALCLTIFVMAPVGKQINEQAVQPYLSDKISSTQFVAKASRPLKAFMLEHTRQSDLDIFAEYSGEPDQDIRDVNSVPVWHLVPAFLLSELKVAFQMAFVVLLPFLLIDLLVAVGLMSLGMMLVPPTTVSLPLKILMFVLVDGWSLLSKSLLSSYS